MNIDNSIGMALFSGELGSTAAIGGQQGSANGMAESPEGSLFQQLINQMLTGKNLTGEAASGNLNTNGKNQTGETADMLSQMLLAGGNLSKLGLQKTENTIGESVEIKGASGELQTSDETPGAMEMLQALMAGMTNTVPTTGVEKAFIGVQAEKTETPKTSAISSSGNVSGNPAAMETLKLMTANAAMQSGRNAETVTADGKTGLTETAEGMTAAQSGIKQILSDQKQTPQTGSSSESAVFSSGKAPAENGIEFQEPDKTVLKTGEAEMPKAFVKTAKAEGGNQPAAFEIPVGKEAAVPVEKLEQETAAADGTDPAGAVFQHSVQGTVAACDITESGTLNQTVESPQPYSQIRQEILTRLEQNGPTEFKMQLQPEDLGQIDIKLKLSEGKLVIDILAADSRTQALLTSQVDKLVSSMGLQNVQVESVQVSQQMNSQTQDNSQSQGFTMSSAMDFSQRKQQEQSQQEILNNSRLAGTFNLQQDETKTNETINRIESIRFNNHRMNYSV